VRVVFDTNIFVSALAFPGGQADKALLRIIEGRDQLLVSRPIIQELLDVLSTKFAQDREELAHAAVFLSELSQSVHPRKKLNVLHDDADNRILECAQSGNADVIVTGDRAMLRHREHGKIRILPLREYLECD
jgi:putative PIN family toxin of toxin-antitoxin system